jgi:hypothetical protein
MKKSPFRWHTSWSGIVLSDDNLILPNTWDFILEYEIVTDEVYFKDIAMQRLDFMIHEKFNSSIWTNFNNSWCSDFYNRINTFIITLPEDPYDSLIAATAMLKAQEITRGAFEIHGCSIISKMGYAVENVIDINDTADMIDAIDTQSVLGGQPWFLRDDAGFTDILHYEDGDANVIKEQESWDVYSLNWDYYDQLEKGEPTVTPLQRARRGQWTPTVIKGGADDNEA